MGQLRIAAVMPLRSGIKAVPFYPVGMVIMHAQFVLIPVALDGAPIANQRGAACGSATARVEVLAVGSVYTRGVLDNGARRIMVARIGRETAQPVVWFDG